MHPVAERELAGARDAIASLCRRYGVTRLWVFGSAAGPEFDPARSDLDFLAEFGPWSESDGPFGQIFGFEAALAATLGRAVDVIEWKSIRNPFFRRRAEATRRTIYEA